MRNVEWMKELDMNIKENDWTWTYQVYFRSYPKKWTHFGHNHLGRGLTWVVRVHFRVPDLNQYFVAFSIISFFEVELEDVNVQVGIENEIEKEIER